MFVVVIKRIEEDGVSAIDSVIGTFSEEWEAMDWINGEFPESERVNGPLEFLITEISEPFTRMFKG